MKKGLLIATALLSAMTLVACGGNGGSKAPAKSSSKASTSKHTHTFADTWENDEEQHWHPATCEHTTQKGSAAAHTWTTVSETPASCSTAGSKVEKCSVCNKQKTTELPKTFHQFTWGTPAEAAGKSTVKTGTCACGKKAIQWAVDAVSEGTVNKDSEDSYKLPSNGATLKYVVPAAAAVNGELYVNAFIDHFDDDNNNGEKGWFWGKNGNSAEQKEVPNIKIEVGETTLTCSSTKSWKECGVTSSSKAGAAYALYGNITLAAGDNAITVTRVDSYGPNFIDFCVIY